MDSRAMVSMNYKAMRFNGLLNNAFIDSRVGILKILKQCLQGMDLKIIVSINFITMGSLGFRTMISMDRF
jgi:hypothetical protein